MIIGEIFLKTVLILLLTIFGIGAAWLGLEKSMHKHQEDDLFYDDEIDQHFWGKKKR